MIFSSWGDAVGRKYPLVLTFVSNIILFTIYILILHFNFSLEWLTVGHFLACLFGGPNLGVATCFAYYADISSKESRTVYISVGETIVGLGYLATGFAVGPWFQAQVCTAFKLMFRLQFFLINKSTTCYSVPSYLRIISSENETCHLMHQVFFYGINTQNKYFYCRAMKYLIMSCSAFKFFVFCT